MIRAVVTQVGGYGTHLFPNRPNNCVSVWKVGAGQADGSAASWGAVVTGIERRRDLAGIDRVVRGRRG